MELRIHMDNIVKNRYKSDFVTHPGTTLLESLEERGMSQVDLSRRTGRPKKTINEIIQGKTAITSETALQLEKVLGIPAIFWVNRQRNYDEYLARVEERNNLEKYIDWIDNFSINNMIKLGWIEKHNDKLDQTIELLNFFGVATPKQWNLVTENTFTSFKLAKTFESSTEDLAAWLRAGEIMAQEIVSKPYNEALFIHLLHNDIRDLTTEPPDVFQPKLINLCASAGVSVAFVPQLPLAKVCGATRWISKGKALIQLSIRYKTDDHLWFTFFHEASHIVIHGKRDIYLESPKETLEDMDKEDEANQFAANILIPREALKSFLDCIPDDRYPSKKQIVNFSEQLGIAPSILVGRLQHDKLPISNPLPYSHYRDLKKTLKWVSDN